jgi:hypothetical protein
MKKTASIDKKELFKLLSTTSLPFVQIEGSTNFSEGWKVSIQGKTVEDAIYLIDRLVILFGVTRVFYKIGTQALINCSNPEQTTKLITVYLPKGVAPESYCELIRNCIPDYTGADTIGEKVGYTKHSPGIFFRNDRDSSGNYVYPDGHV